MRPLAVLLATLVLLAGCTEEQGTNVDPELVDAVAAPEAGACRVLTPDDVASAIYLLCLPEARMINGHTLVVDGGFAISG